MTISKRDLLRLGWGAASASVVLISPMTFDLGRSLPLLVLNSAEAKSGNNGNGANGNDNGSGGSSAGGNGNGNGNGNGRSPSGGRSVNGTGSPSSSNNGASGQGGAATGGDARIGIRHDNGITETISHGRFVMRDSRGRTIVDREATSADYRRLSNRAD
jgi:hypothetical protein